MACVCTFTCVVTYPPIIHTGGCIEKHMGAQLRGQPVGCPVYEPRRWRLRQLSVRALARLVSPARGAHPGALTPRSARTPSCGTAWTSAVTAGHVSDCLRRHASSQRDGGGACARSSTAAHASRQVQGCVAHPVALIAAPRLHLLHTIPLGGLRHAAHMRFSGNWHTANSERGKRTPCRA